MEYVLQDVRAEVYLLLNFLTGILFLPVWVWITGTWGKKPTWLAATILPSSMQADVIDDDELLCDRRREWLFIGLWSIIKTIPSALGLDLALPLLALAGYDPGREQPEPVILLLRFLSRYPFCRSIAPPSPF